MKKIKNNSKTKKMISFISVIVVVMIISLTTGFSAFSASGLVTDIGATVMPQKDIRVTGVLAKNPVSGGVSNYEEYGSNYISSAVSLPNASSKITYQVEVTNFGNVEMVLKQLSGLPSNLKYTIDSSTYKMNDMICDDNDDSKCTLGARKTIDIVIEYASGGYDSSNTTYTFQLDFTFDTFNKVAQIGTKYYQSLTDAIAKVPTDGTATTVILLQDTSENIVIASTQNVILDLQSNTLSNDGNDNVIKNNGTLSISNGLITSNAATNGAINNNSTGTITISGGRIIMTGGRQALYNDKGNATISGSAYLKASTSDRAAVQNVSGGTMTITGGTIISTGTFALNNLGSLTIGVQDNNIDRTKPVIISTAASAITTTTNMNFYNGVSKAKGSNLPFNNVAKVTGTESGYGIVYSQETIDGVKYRVGYLGVQRKVTFSANGGTVTESSRFVEAGQPVGDLPTPTYEKNVFDGWFTARTGGTQINENTVINSNVTYYAHWTIVSQAARIGQTTYSTLQDAVNAAPDNVQTTIELLEDVTERVTVGSAKNIIFDFAGRTLRNNNNAPIIESEGIISISNGTLASTANQGTINISGGSCTISGGSISGTNRQAVYITGGTVEITGTANLTSSCSGKPSGSSMERGTVQVIAGTLYVTGGTIIATAQQAITNEGTVIIGTEGGSVSTTSPVLQGYINGIKTTGIFRFYDGIIKGGTTAVNGTITSWQSGTTPTDGTETIGSKTYYTKYLDAS